jgi:acetoacetyl-CoA synthetase
MPLFLVLADGAEPDQARREVVAAIRRTLSPRHLPDEIVIAPAIPHTRTGKKLEVPIKRLLQGAAVRDVADLASVDDPHAMEFYVNFARGRREAADV